MSIDRADFRESKQELGAIVREVSAWRNRLQTVLGLVHAAETEGERETAASLARKLQDRMVGAAKRVQTFSRRLGELAEQLERQAAAASDGHNDQQEKE